MRFLLWSGNLEKGQVGNRHAEQLEGRLLHPDGLCFAVLNHPLGFHLPQGRAFRVLFALLTGRVDTIVEGGLGAVAALGTFGRNAGVVRCFDSGAH